MLDRGSAENRLKLFISGDILLGAAPPIPPPPRLEITYNKIEFILVDLIEQANWEYSWDAGVSWEQGNGSSLILLKSNKQQLNLRQTDRWGRVSEENLILIEPEKITYVTPELILPASTNRTKILKPITATVEGDQYILWSMDQSMTAETELSKGIRAAIEEIDGVIDIDFKELKWDESFRYKPGALQLLFSSELDSAISFEPTASNLINLQRKRISKQIAGIELILEDRMRIQLTNLINKNNISYALLQVH